MTRVQPGQRKRVRAPKVRTGCGTCKIRKVKCDEARPICKRCSSTGRICDGYEQSDNLVAPDLIPGPREEAAVLAVARGPGNPSHETRETRSLQFFFEVTAAQFATFFSEDMWNSTVLQIAQSHPCIRHALVALSARHEQYTRQNLAALDGKFPLQQYGRAIRELNSSEAQSPTHIHLLSCLLFICAEAVQGNFESAVALVRCGQNMIDDLIRTRERSGSGTQEEKEATDLDVLLKQIIDHFSNLAVQVSLLIGNTKRRPPLQTPNDGNQHGEDLALLLPPSMSVGTFMTLADARHALMLIVQVTFEVQDALVGGRNVGNTVHSVISWLERWSQAFNSLCTSLQKPALSQSDARAMTLLRLQSQFLLVKLQDMRLHATNGADGETGDIVSLSDLVDYAEEAWSWDGGLNDEMPLFHTGLGVVPILFGIIVKSRDSTIRNRALRLMHSRSVQEGLWNSILTARVAKRVIELEEAQLASSPQQRELSKDKIISVEANLCEEDNGATITYVLANSQERQHLTW